jgi:glycine/D-amino acid oxidase-like deaminating enzyme
VIALYIAAAWIGAGVLLGPLVGRFLKHCSTHDAPQGRNGDPS